MEELTVEAREHTDRDGVPMTHVFSDLWVRMVQLTSGIHARSPRPVSPRTAEERSGAFRGLLQGLDQPMHLFAFLTGGNHYHFGEFVHPRDSLLHAQERLTTSCASSLPRGSRVLDVGCGLGGSSMMLSRLGHRVVAVDPSGRALDMARASANGNHGLRFEPLAFGSEQLSRVARDEPFDGFLFIEVLQYFQDLDELLINVRKMAHPTSALVFADAFCEGPHARHGVPHHGANDLCRALDRAGVELMSRRVMTKSILPTLDRVRELLDSQQRELVEFFEESRPDVRAEIRELEAHCKHLRAAFKNGDLVYEIVTAGCTD